MYVCLFYMVIYVSRLGGCVRRSFYLDILFPHSLPYRDILLVYLKENCALFALLAFFPKQRKCQVSCHVSQSMSKPDNYNIHSHRSESVLIFFLFYLT